MKSYNLSDLQKESVRVDMFEELYYGSYSSNREGGMTHEDAVKIGIGKDRYLGRYNSERAREGAANASQTQGD